MTFINLFNGYDCLKCFQALAAQYPKDVVIGRRMIGCVTCGNKRCPKATDHELTCTGSNDPGQPGSIYTATPTPQERA